MLSILYLSLLMAQTDEVFLPQWMTPAESLRIDEIGKGHIVTPPPGGWVETPGEFEHLKGVFVTWRYGYGSDQDVIFRKIVKEVVEVSKAFIIARNSSEQTNITNYLNSGGVPLDSVEFMLFSNNSIWMRDYGPWFIRQQDNTEGIVDFIYNRPRPQDDTIPWRIGQQWGISVYGSPLEHPGGNFMVDGIGTGFASTLIYEENPSYSPEEIDSLMLAYNGLEQFIVLPRINIEYTGHIDLWTKALNDTLIMVGEYLNPSHPNYGLLNQNADSISHCKNCEGFPYRVVRIPLPYSTSNAPPTYLNSLFVNNKVLIPLWNEPEDDTALFIYQQVLPDHQIIGIDCSAMAGSGGAIHCITMQAPASKFLHVKHTPLDNTGDTLNPYRVRARIITSNNLITDSTIIFYKINDGSFNTVPLLPVADTPGVYIGYIPAQSAADTVHYYILAKNNDNIRRTSPIDAPLHIYTFYIYSIGVKENIAVSVSPEFFVYPNPTTRNLIFSISLKEESNLGIEIYNALGQKIKSHFYGKLKSGYYEIPWGFCNELTPGTYFYRIITDGKTKIGKILLIK